MKRSTTEGSVARSAWPATRPLAAATALLAAVALWGCGAGEETGAAEEGEMAADTAAALGGEGMAGEEDAVGEATEEGLLNANEAPESALRGVEALPETAATVILDGRPFADVVALDEALSAHVDSTARTELYRRVWIPIDLNEASDEAILLIPGVGDRMLHEFKEYRPYHAMEQFRREIGKYVDDEELARLERYVTIGGGA